MDAAQQQLQRSAALPFASLLDAAMGRYQGKQTGEAALWRTLLDEQVEPDDVVLADRLYGTYFDILLVQQRGADAVFRLHNGRHPDFRCGRKLGRYDQVVRWTKPRQRPDWMDAATYAAMPATLEVRLVRVRVAQKGFRTEVLDLVTTLLDAACYTPADLAGLYRMRWHAELDLRSLKVTLHMDVLRCKTPEMVRKEVWAHLGAADSPTRFSSCLRQD
jgi:IS4 transposase